jgi:hypothetical protein
MVGSSEPRLRLYASTAQPTELGPRLRANPKLAPLHRETRAAAGAPRVKPHLSFLCSAAHPQTANPHLPNAPPNTKFSEHPRGNLSRSSQCPTIAAPRVSAPPPPVSPACSSVPIVWLLFFFRVLLLGLGLAVPRSHTPFPLPYPYAIRQCGSRRGCPSFAMEPKGASSSSSTSTISPR